MSSPEQLDMESKRDILAIRVMKMKKASMSQEEINEGLKQLIVTAVSCNFTKYRRRGLEPAASVRAVG